MPALAVAVDGEEIVIAQRDAHLLRRKAGIGEQIEHGGNSHQSIGVAEEGAEVIPVRAVLLASNHVLRVGTPVRRRMDALFQLQPELHVSQPDQIPAADDGGHRHRRAVEQGSVA